jgi:hypothetical protein
MSQAASTLRASISAPGLIACEALKPSKRSLRVGSAIWRFGNCCHRFKACLQITDQIFGVFQADMKSQQWALLPGLNAS